MTKQNRSRPQLRRCGTCDKVGHNSARCPSLRPKNLKKIKTAPQQPVVLSSVVKKSPLPPPPPAEKPAAPGRALNFYIHHVNHAPPHSNHTVNLKTSAPTIWKNVESNAPLQSSNPGYHFYHETKDNAPKKFTPPIPSDKLLSAKKTSPETGLEQLPKLRQNFLTAKRQPILSWTKFNQWYEHQAQTLDDTAHTLGNKFRTKTKKIYSLSRLTALLVIIFLTSTVPTSATGYYHNLKTGQQTLIEQGTAGFTTLAKSAKQLIGGDFKTASIHSTEAVANFDTALNVLSEHSLLASAASLVPGIHNQINGGERLLLAGQEIALGSHTLITALNSLAESPSSTPTTRLATLISYLDQALPNFERGLANVESVNPSILPPAYQKSFADFKIAYGAVVHDLRHLIDLGKTLPDMFGGVGLRRYLIVFQNPYELRPTGGFMGSFAVLEMKDGLITKLDVAPGGTYDLQGQLDTYVEPPTPLLLTNKRWEFQDANWFPDFPTSAEKILWFYRHSRGVTADGVIAINSSVLERLLTIIGPITDDKRQLTLSNTSALTTIQNEVENGPEKAANKPKQILADLAPHLLETVRALPPQQLLNVLFNLEEALGQKEIQAYFRDPKQQATIEQFGWDGRILSTSPTQDYLFTVAANIQGQKSDAKIKQTINHQAVVNDDGSVVDTVIITREHEGTPGEKMYGEQNNVYLRLYVPLGSELISANGFSWPEESHFRAPEKWTGLDELLTSVEKPIGFEPNSGTKLTEEFNKTVFGNWVITNPGEVSRVEFTYRLPFKVIKPSETNQPLNNVANLLPVNKTAHYQLVAQRQSGASSSFSSQIIFPSLWGPAWSSGENISLADNGAEISLLPLTRDQIWSLVMEKN